MKIAASREPAVKINAAKPPRNSELAAIAVIFYDNRSAYTHYTVNTKEQHETPHKTYV